MVREKPTISVIVPVHNGAETIDKCLTSIYASTYKNFEVIVVDDCSNDDSVEIINRFPCKLIGLEKHVGVSKARNIGAKHAKGKILFFTDSDCILEKNTLELIINSMGEEGVKVVGGTYTRIPYDKDNFFSIFQSLYGHYGETKTKYPDYIATHCLAIDAALFNGFNGFIEDSFIGVAASVEDVELCHRLKREGHSLVMNPNILVQHIVNFSMAKSLKNAIKRTMFWTAYSLKNKDILKDSGCAGLEIKFNVVSLFLNVLLFFMFLLSNNPLFLFLVLLLFLSNIIVNFKFFNMIHNTKGLFFTLMAATYYISFYALAVGIGSFIGMIKFIWSIKLLRRY